jgi:uncharacterized protein
MDNKIIIAVVIIAIFLVGGFLLNSNSSATVTAQGTSVLEVMPNKVSINLNVQAKGETSQEAKDAHDEIIEKVFVELIIAGLDRDEIKMVNFNIYPEYIYDNGKRTQNGFSAIQSLVVETTNFDTVPQIVDAAIEGGALVSYINFELSEVSQSDYKAQALEAAGKDAKKKAEATAAGLGKKLGSLVAVKSQDFNYGPFRYFEADAAIGSIAEAREAAINIAPQDIEVRATVGVEYKLRNF